MKHLLVAALLSLCASVPALAWNNHALASYRAFENLPEVAHAPPVAAEPLEYFLHDQAGPLAALLAAQDAWAQSHVPTYPPLPAALRFDATVAAQGPQALRQAFLTALRVSPLSRLALYVQPDPWAGPPVGERLPHDAVSALPVRSTDGTGHVFIRIHPGQPIAPLAVLASACDEPDYGMDLLLWQDSGSPWGKRYGFGPLPFGNPKLALSTQAPFHMGFFHERAIVYLAAGFLKRTYPLLRIHQYLGLSELAFRSGHPYWGWRFAGLAVHYVQDLTQPYHSSLAPGFATARLLGINLLAMLGMPGPKADLVTLLSNRHFVIENYEGQLLLADARTRQNGPLEQALHDTTQDAGYGPWNDAYALNVVSRQAHDEGETVTTQLLASAPARYVSDPGFDFGVHAPEIDLMSELQQHDTASRTMLQNTLAALMRNFGAHSRNLVRGVLHAVNPR